MCPLADAVAALMPSDDQWQGARHHRLTKVEYPEGIVLISYYRPKPAGERQVSWVNARIAGRVSSHRRNWHIGVLVPTNTM